MAELQIDLQEFIMALQDNSMMCEWFLDLETGDVVFRWEEAGTEEMEELYALLESTPDRFRRIEGIPSPTAFSVMEDFATNEASGEVQEALLDSLAGRKPFRKFKDRPLRLARCSEEVVRL